MNTDTSQIDKTLGRITSTTKMRDNDLTKINVHRIKFPVEGFGRGIGYAFFTKPSLNIIDAAGNANPELGNVPYLNFMKNTNLELVSSLCYQYNSSPFMTILSNKCTGFDLSDEVLKTQHKGETFQGWKIPYSKHAVESRTGFSISVPFEDNADLDVYNTFKAWVTYMEAVNRGTIAPAKTMIDNLVLDYAISIYYFVLSTDNKNIRFYAKLTGLFPTSIPNSVFSTSEMKNIKDPKYSINFEVAFAEYMDPRILAEFNMLGSGGTQHPMYDFKNMTPGDAWAKGANVVSNNGRLQLVFTK